MYVNPGAGGNIGRNFGCHGCLLDKNGRLIESSPCKPAVTRASGVLTKQKTASSRRCSLQAGRVRCVPCPGAYFFSMSSWPMWSKSSRW